MINHIMMPLLQPRIFLHYIKPMTKERRGDRSRSPPNKVYTLGGSQLRGSTKSELSTNYNIPDEDLALVPHTKTRKIWSHNKTMNVPISTYTALVSSKCRPVVCHADSGELCFSQGSRINLSELGKCNTDGSVSEVKTFKDKVTFISDLFGSLDGSLVALFKRHGFTVTFPDFTVENEFLYHESHEVTINFVVEDHGTCSIAFPQNYRYRLPSVHTPDDDIFWVGADPDNPEPPPQIERVVEALFAKVKGILGSRLSGIARFENWQDKQILLYFKASSSGFQDLEKASSRCATPGPREGGEENHDPGWLRYSHVSRGREHEEAGYRGDSGHRCPGAATPSSWQIT